MKSGPPNTPGLNGGTTGSTGNKYEQLFSPSSVVVAVDAVSQTPEPSKLTMSMVVVTHTGKGRAA